ncbi:hypothetical protein [Hydrogenophaga sp. OTU3427]|jgi:hypothetical protein|uniref:hypothetical protein n=1 Tax=Hydrogenophaga sp. OTU3427 TaxID=3043856 RepID=UPI00313F13BA
MASPESIYRLLRVASKLLDQAASEIRDGKLEPVRGNIEHIGRALSEIFDIRQKIYEVRPDLKREYLSEPSPNPEANRLLTRFMFEASELEDGGRTAEAIEKYKEFLAIETSELHREIAESEIMRLSGE